MPPQTIPYLLLPLALRKHGNTEWKEIVELKIGANQHPGINSIAAQATFDILKWLTKICTFMQFRQDDICIFIHFEEKK